VHLSGKLLCVRGSVEASADEGAVQVAGCFGLDGCVVSLGVSHSEYNVVLRGQLTQGLDKVHHGAVGRAEKLVSSAVFLRRVLGGSA
jgi:hypothetical protein